MVGGKHIVQCNKNNWWKYGRIKKWLKKLRNYKNIAKYEYHMYHLEDLPCQCYQALCPRLTWPLTVMWERQPLSGRGRRECATLMFTFQANPPTWRGHPSAHASVPGWLFHVFCIRQCESSAVSLIQPRLHKSTIMFTVCRHSPNVKKKGIKQLRTRPEHTCTVKYGWYIKKTYFEMILLCITIKLNQNTFGLSTVLPL